MQESHEYETTDEAAMILGVSANTLRSWADSGELPAPGDPAHG